MAVYILVKIGMFWNPRNITLSISTKFCACWSPGPTITHSQVRYWHNIKSVLRRVCVQIAYPLHVLLGSCWMFTHSFNSRALPGTDAIRWCRWGRTRHGTYQDEDTELESYCWCCRLHLSQLMIDGVVVPAAAQSWCRTVLYNLSQTLTPR
jgi:hypothetical protein